MIGAHVAVLILATASAAQERPFPENRVRDFYVDQARKFLSSGKPLPELLPEFPGLDGGTFGHWGQNPEADNFDPTLNEVEIGNLLAQVVNHDGRRTTKAVSVRIGDRGGVTVMFDPMHLSFTESWKGGLVKWESRRYGITSGVKPAGPRFMDLRGSTWELPEGTPRKYLGFYRSGKRVVFRYRIGGATVLDHAWMESGTLVRSLSIEGALPAPTELVLAKAGIGNVTVLANGETAAIKENVLRVRLSDLRVKTAIHLLIGDKVDRVEFPSPASFTRGGTAQWKDRTVTTRGTLGTGRGPYVIDTITIPYRKENPFGTPMRVGGFDFLPDGRAAVATIMGDVWLVDGIDEDLDRNTWKRIASGLHQALGLVVRNGKILVLGRDQITRLHDLNSDDEADYYECVTNEFPTDGGNAFALTLHDDDAGNLYWFTRSSRFGMTKFAPGGKPEQIATGLRGTNGTGVSPDGKIVLATAQEGSWTPATAIFEVGGGSYHGFHGPREEVGPYGYDLPLCFVPRGIDNSSGDLAFIPNDKRWGPLAGKIIGTSFGSCQHYLVLREEIGGGVQGGIVPLPGDFLSGACRSRFNSRDGHFYVSGTDGWESYAKENGSLQRVRYVGGPMPLPVEVRTHENGLRVTFNTPIDPRSVRLEKVFAEQWNYLYSKAYGSAEYSVRQPGRRGHDPVEVRSVRLLEDGRTVFVEIPHLHPVMQFHLYMELVTRGGDAFTPDLYYSIFSLRKPFTDFDGYRPVTRKKHYPKFPVATEYPRDPRLDRQEQLGKSVWPMVNLRVDAVPGLQYAPRVLRAPPERRVAITFRNRDVEMPHNFVLVRPDRFESVGETAMLLAADPRAIATHYVPDDPGILAFSPIIEIGGRYTIYLNSPKKEGAYPFACSFPGHWKVMRGVLYVLEEGKPLPANAAPEAPARKFVRMWKTEDLAPEAETLAGRSLERGRKVFTEAGCIKCHRIGDQGTALGPDLTKVTERFKGANLLRQILEPSTEIHKDYAAWLIRTNDSAVVTGLIVRREKDAIHVLPNPLKPGEIKIVRTADIDEMKASAQSTMPKGLLMTYDKDEILDLLKFVQSGGAP